MEDHVLGCIESSLGGCQYESRVAATGASTRQGLCWRVLQVVLRNTKDCLQLGVVAECAHEDEYRDCYVVVNYRICCKRVDRIHRDVIFVRESMPIAWMEFDVWTEYQLNEKQDLRKKAVPDGNDEDKVVAIPSHQDEEIETHSEFRRQIKIEMDRSLREILLGKMEVICGSTELLTTPAMKVQERLDKDRTLFRRATMRASFVFYNRANVQQVTKGNTTIHLRVKRPGVFNTNSDANHSRFHRS